MCGAHRDQKMALGSLELELQVVVSCLLWVLGTRTGFGPSFAGAVCVLGSCAVSTALHCSFFPLKISLAVLKLALQTRLASNSLRSSCLCLPSAGIKGMCYHHLATMLLSKAGIVWGYKSSWITLDTKLGCSLAG